MLFNSYSFLLGFLPVAVAGYYALGTRPWAAKAWLALLSVIFYAWTDPRLAILLGGSIAYNYMSGAALLRWSERERQAQGLLILGIAGNLLLLFYYKYLAALLGFAAEYGLHFGALRAIALPLGISFFTFTQIGYLIDCRAGIVKTNHLLDYVLFVTFFPHLIAGPILHHREMLPQFRDPKLGRFELSNLVGGSLIFLMGLTKKVCVADPLSFVSNPLFASPMVPGPAAAWQGALAYSLQLYFDFSGYSDMALGLARMFGFKFPLNFNSPYRASSVIDYWQRWHMTLTRYLTLYLYNPLALAITRRRVALGQPIGPAGVSQVSGFLGMVVLPVTFTMTLAGVWHGAGRTFLVFGFLHAFYLTVNHAWRVFGPKPAGGGQVRGKLALVGSVALTYLSVLVAQIYFRASTVAGATHIVLALVGVSEGGEATSASPLVMGLIGLLFAVAWLLPNTAQIFHRFEPTLTKLRLDSPLNFEWKPRVDWALATAVTLLLDLMGMAGTTEFLYFRF